MYSWTGWLQFADFYKVTESVLKAIYMGELVYTNMVDFMAQWCVADFLEVADLHPAMNRLMRTMNIEEQLLPLLHAAVHEGFLAEGVGKVTLRAIFHQYWSDLIDPPVSLPATAAEIALASQGWLESHHELLAAVPCTWLLDILNDPTFVVLDETLLLDFVMPGLTGGFWSDDDKKNMISALRFAHVNEAAIWKACRDFKVISADLALDALVMQKLLFGVIKLDLPTSFYNTHQTALGNTLVKEVMRPIAHENVSNMLDLFVRHCRPATILNDAFCAASTTRLAYRFSGRAVLPPAAGNDCRRIDRTLAITVARDDESGRFAKMHLLFQFRPTGTAWPIARMADMTLTSLVLMPVVPAGTPATDIPQPVDLDLSLGTPKLEILPDRHMARFSISIPTPLIDIASVSFRFDLTPESHAAQIRAGPSREGMSIPLSIDLDIYGVPTMSELVDTKLKRLGPCVQAHLQALLVKADLADTLESPEPHVDSPDIMPATKKQRVK